MSFILKILESSDIERAKLEGLPWMRAMVEGQASQEDYLAFLFDLYHVVKHFCPTMAAAFSRCGDDGSPLRLHLQQAMHEEQGHDEMVLDDVKAFRVDVAQVISRQPSPPVVALLASNYHLVDRDHPAMVLGMLYTQEFMASCYAGLVANNMAESLGMSGDTGFSFLLSHSSLDQEHVVRLHNLIATFDNPGVQDKIVQAINLNFYLLRQWVQHLMKQPPETAGTVRK